MPHAPTCFATTKQTFRILAQGPDANFARCAHAPTGGALRSTGWWTPLQVRDASLSRMWLPYRCMSNAGRASCSSSKGCILCRQLDTRAASSVCTSAAAAACPHTSTGALSRRRQAHTPWSGSSKAGQDADVAPQFTTLGISRAMPSVPAAMHLGSCKAFQQEHNTSGAHCCDVHVFQSDIMVM